MIYMTGDLHRDFERLFWFCKRTTTTVENDIMILLGDVGLNYYGGWRDHHAKQELSSLPLTFLCVHGNHEQRPQSVGGYRIKPWRGDFVYYEEEFPNILFALDGAVYDLNGLSTMTIGGAYSVDKDERIDAMMNGFTQYKWFADEQPSQETKDLCEQVLHERGNQVDVMLTHTCPMNMRPVHAFLPSIDQSTVDTSTEEWLQTIFDKNSISHWYSAHYHVDYTIDNHKILYRDIITFPTFTGKEGADESQ